MDQPMTVRDLLKIVVTEDADDDFDLDKPLSVSPGVGWYPVVHVHVTPKSVCLQLGEEPE